MAGFLFVLILIGAAAFAIWFFGPQATDSIKLKRENARIVNLTKQTKRDMDDLARRQRRQDRW